MRCPILLPYRHLSRCAAFSWTMLPRCLALEEIEFLGGKDSMCSHHNLGQAMLGTFLWAPREMFGRPGKVWCTHKVE